ncbi:hypothetical protein HOLleu_42046 [Holothuria leucospilota]|uniref:Uncharacterized protein n=1 Tax=Holothuria leucospilota TaxID=206669 RepID=A0A9Q1BAC1_HOLLE|nr:hypothetical protein HOLleu_42046 [Holothuria leucospilota]
MLRRCRRIFAFFVDLTLFAGYISISQVRLNNCYSTVDLRGGNHLQLKSNLSIPVLTTLNTLWIQEPGREITSEEFTGILQYSSKCLALKELWFVWCLLPLSIQAESVSVLRSRNVKGNIQPIILCVMKKK